MIIFYNCKNLPLLFLMLCVLLFFCSCETLKFADNAETYQVELNIKDIFTNDMPDHEYNLLQKIFEESNIRFFMSYNDDNTMQDVLKEIAIVESAEKTALFTIKKAEELFASNINDITAGNIEPDGIYPTDIERAEKLFLLAFSVKQLLIKCIKNIPSLTDEIEQIIEEKKWEMEYDADTDADMDASELFFDIIRLENSVSYLNSVKKTLTKNIAELNNIVNKTEAIY